MYIGETARNFEIRVNEHSDVNKQSKPAKHIRKHLNHKFTWEVLQCDYSDQSHPTKFFTNLTNENRGGYE